MHLPVYLAVHHTGHTCVGSYIALRIIVSRTCVGWCTCLCIQIYKLHHAVHITQLPMYWITHILYDVDHTYDALVQVHPNMNIASRITVYWITHACAMCISIHCNAHHRITQVIYEGWCTCLCIFNWITQVTLPVYWIKLVDALACASQLRSPGANQVPPPAPGHKYLWENLPTNICPQNQMRIFGFCKT